MGKIQAQLKNQDDKLNIIAHITYGIHFAKEPRDGPSRSKVPTIPLWDDG